MSVTEMSIGNHKARVTHVHNKYRVIVMCMSGTHSEGDVLFLQSYEKEATAMRAAKRKLEKFST
jgi:ribosomal protein S28E/S33